MKQEKLECLLNSFILSRKETDAFDGIADTAPYHTDEVDNSFQRLDSDGDQYHYREDLRRAGTVASSSYALSQAIESTEVLALGRHLRTLANQFSMIPSDNCCVKFEKSCIFVAPEEQTISLTVVRSDVSADTVTKVFWKTLDKTALSGTHYVGSSGEILFDKGITEKIIQIKILKTSDDNSDLRFNVVMSIDNDTSNPRPMTVTLKNLNNFYDDERQVITSLPSKPFTVEDIRSILEISLNIRTFHMALTHLCSGVDSVPLEFALAFDLSRLCISKLQRVSVVKVLNDFFRTEDIES